MIIDLKICDVITMQSLSALQELIASGRHSTVYLLT